MDEINRFTKQLKYCTYARKSSESEEKQALSIESQINELRTLAEGRQIKDTRIYQESYSAYKPGRPVFEQMIKDIEAGTYDAIITWSPDRLSRNSMDTGKLVYLMDLGLLKEIVTPSQTFRNTPNDKFMFSMMASNAKYENDNKSLNVKRGLKTKAEKGQYPCPAPTGYMNDRLAEKGNKKIFNDPDRFPIVKKMFEMVLEQKYTVPQVFERIEKEYKLTSTKGRPLVRSALYHMLNNPFYYGQYEYPLRSGKWYIGTHNAMITHEEYRKIQLILGSKAKARDRKLDFAFKGMMTCGQCGAMITCEQKIKRPKNGKVHKYIYYHCTKQKDPSCPQVSVEEKELLKQIDDTLGQIEIPASFHQWAFKWFKKVYADEVEDRNHSLNIHEDAHRKITQKIDRLVDMRANGEIDQETFNTKVHIAEDERKRQKELIDDTGHRIGTWLERAEQLFDFAEHARAKFAAGDREVKREILRSLDSNLYIKDKMFRPDMTNAILQLKTIQSEYSSKKSIFEPVDKPITTAQREALYEGNPRMLRALYAIRTHLISNLHPL